jgi:nucleoside-diphosphate-sugar epimerase
MSSHLVLGAGPLGQHLTRQLVGSGQPVAIASRRGAPVDGAAAIAADLLDPEALGIRAVDALGGPVDVVYFAAQPEYTLWPEEFPALHQAAIALAESLGAVLVAAENTYGYGPVAEPMHEGLPLAATTRKGATRAAMSRELFAAHDEGRVRATAGRASDFFGPAVFGSVLGAPFFGPILAGGPLPVLAAADQPHSWTYVPDFAAALIRLGGDERALGRAWHVPCVEPLSVRELAARTWELAGVAPVEIEVMPSAAVEAAAEHDPMMREFAELLYEFEAPYVVDWSAYEATFGGGPTELDRALQATIAAFAQIGAPS